ncbi:MAG: hypothetical protein Q8L24_02610 [bacterium]|nr:hypothetical protein [bacterium]
MKRFALMALAPALFFGLIGCAEERVYNPENDPNPTPERISVLVESAQLIREGGLLYTKVVFAWRGASSDPVYFPGDQMDAISIGMEFSDVELVDWVNRAGAQVYRLRYKPTSRSYLLRFPERTKELK